MIVYLPSCSSVILWQTNILAIAITVEPKMIERSYLILKPFHIIPGSVTSVINETPALLNQTNFPDCIIMHDIHSIHIHNIIELTRNFF